MVQRRAQPLDEGRRRAFLPSGRFRWLSSRARETQKGRGVRRVEGQGRGVGEGDGLGDGFGVGVGLGVGVGSGEGVGVGLGLGVGFGVGVGFGLGVGLGSGAQSQFLSPPQGSFEEAVISTSWKSPSRSGRPSRSTEMFLKLGWLAGVLPSL
jgi:hypothetical protein